MSFKYCAEKRVAATDNIVGYKKELFLAKFMQKKEPTKLKQLAFVYSTS